MKNKNRIRTCLRSLLSKHLYNQLAVSANKLETIRCQGLSVYKQLYKVPQEINEIQKVNLRKIQYPVYFRPNTIDVPTLIQNLIRKEYSKGLKEYKPKFIIDAGCYIGDVSIFYLNKFPNSKIIALEPNESNFKIAKLNLEPYKERIELIRKGLWSTKTILSFKGEFTGGGLVLNNETEQKIECIDITSLLSEYKFDDLDLLKIDIEGAENEVILNNSDTWLRKTKMIAIEFHGEDIKQQCLKKLYEYDFEGFEYRSIYHLYNKNLF